MVAERKYDWLIVGAGLFGAVFAYRARRAGQRCLVIDRRPHTGGNVYCENIAGINVHKYGAHIFHTSNEEVWRFVTSLVEFNRYINSPVAVCGGRAYNLPFNMNTFAQMWGGEFLTPERAGAIIERQRREFAEKLAARGDAEPRNLEEQAMLLVGRDIYEKLIRGYTEKQWGRPCTELPPFIIKRLPVRFVYDNNYFNDKYQGIPVGGYNRLVDRLLEGVEVVTDTDFFDDRSHWESVARRMVFTGKIDEFFGYRFGKLEYRTVRFETETLDMPNYQGNAVVNYTDREVPCTRVIEHKHFESFGPDVYANGRTVVSREYSAEWKEGMEPFYPVNDARNNALYERYRELAVSSYPSVVFGGRLAEYKYYDMDKIIERALSIEL